MNYFGKSIISIDSYEGKVPCGSIYHSDYKQRIDFKGVMEFLHKMEQIMEKIKPSDENIRYRTFDHESEENTILNYIEPNLTESLPKGKKATFILQILFRRNCSWQGTLVWLEGKKNENFRSFLELLWLINSALCDKEETGEDA